MKKKTPAPTHINEQPVENEKPEQIIREETESVRTLLTMGEDSRDEEVLSSSATLLRSKMRMLNLNKPKEALLAEAVENIAIAIENNESSEDIVGLCTELLELEK